MAPTHRRPRTSRTVRRRNTDTAGMAYRASPTLRSSLASRIIDASRRRIPPGHLGTGAAAHHSRLRLHAEAGLEAEHGPARDERATEGRAPAPREGLVGAREGHARSLIAWQSATIFAKSSPVGARPLHEMKSAFAIAHASERYAASVTDGTNTRRPHVTIHTPLASYFRITAACPPHEPGASGPERSGPTAGHGSVPHACAAAGSSTPTTQHPRSEIARLICVVSEWSTSANAAILSPPIPTFAQPARTSLTTQPPSVASPATPSQPPNARYASRMSESARRLGASVFALRQMTAFAGATQAQSPTISLLPSSHLPPTGPVQSHAGGGAGRSAAKKEPNRTEWWAWSGG